MSLEKLQDLEEGEGVNVIILNVDMMKMIMMRCVAFKVISFGTCS